MNKKMLEVAKKYKEDIYSIVNYVTENGKEDFIRSYDIFQGWSAKVMLKENGSLYITGFMSYNNTTMEEYNGREICILNITSRELNENDDIDYDFDIWIDNIYEDIERRLQDYINANEM